MPTQPNKNAQLQTNITNKEKCCIMLLLVVTTISHLIGFFLKLKHIKIPRATYINHKCLRNDINVWQ